MTPSPTATATAVPSAMPPPRAAVRPRGVPLLGALPSVLADPVRSLAQVVHRHRGAVVSVPLGPARLYLPTTPQQVEHIYYGHWRNYPKGSGGMYKVVRRVYGDSLVTLDGDSWLNDRRLMQPFFSRKAFEGLTEEIIASIADTLDALVPRAAKGEPLVMNREMSNLAERVVLRALFGLGSDGGAIGSEQGRALRASAAEAFDGMLTRMFFFFLPEALPLPGELGLRRGLRHLNAALAQLLEERRADPVPGKDLVSMLVRYRDEKTGAPLIDRHMRDELVTMFFAGQETTAVTLGWALYQLGRNPELLERLVAEADSVLGTATPTPTQLSQLPFARRVVQETLRFYPPAWIVPRTCSGDVVDGYEIPAGAVVGIPTWAIHHDPASWERPEAFEPDRFLQSASWSKGQYVPFGGGPRVCIGDQFALAEATAALAMFVQRFRPRLASTREIRETGRGAELKPARDILMYCEPR